MGKKVLKQNIQGEITKNNINYSPDDQEKLDPLFPEELGSRDIGIVAGIKQNRNRMKLDGDFPDRLPTNKLYPYPIDEHIFIGQFETKKNLYLLLAHAYNKAMKRIDDLENRITTLESGQ